MFYTSKMIHTDVLAFGRATMLVWKTRYDGYFKKKFPDNPASVIYRLHNMINYWAVLKKSQG
jgi:hypothetical protein